MPIENIGASLVQAVQPQTIQPYDVRWNDVFTKQDIVPAEEPAFINPFDTFYNAALDTLEETNGYKLTSDKLQQDLATGKTSDILGVLLAQDKAYSSLNFTVQVTNKIIESYREIMRMQI